MLSTKSASKPIFSFHIMSLQHLDATSFFEPAEYERHLADSALDEPEFRPKSAHSGRAADLSFLSANFSSESLHTDLDATPQTPQTPAFTLAAQASLSNSASYSAANLAHSSLSNLTNNHQNFPYASKRYSFNGSNSSLVNSPAAPVGQPSFSHHQRTGSNSASSRPRPRSFFGGDTSNIPIWEYGGTSPLMDKTTSAANTAGTAGIAAGQIPDLERPRNRNSGHFSSRRSSYTPVASLLPPSEVRTPRLRSGSPSRESSPVRHYHASPQRQRASLPSKMQPFNFQPQDLGIPSIGHGHSPSLVAKPAHRKGHRYKHSSVSMNLFQEPLPIIDANQQPNLIPDLYPIPNFKESFGSADKSQKFKLGLSLAHALTAVIVFIAGARMQQHAFSTLAHLVFYDSLGSLMAACVAIMSNFEVWGKSSIAYPFGLGRLEVLTSFALSTSLVMVGCDLISHFVEEMIVGLVDPKLAESADHGAHHIHASSQTTTVGWILYELVLVLAIAVTWITSTYIFDLPLLLELMVKPDQKSASASTKETGILDASTTSLPHKNEIVHRLKCVLSILVNNPIRLLTLVYALFLLVVPIVPESLKDQFGFDLNESSTLVVASLLCYAGWNLVQTLGGILLVSFPYSDYDFTVTKQTVLDKILNLACFKAAYNIEKLHFTKASPSFYLAGVQVRMQGGSSDDESRLVFEINRIIVDTLKKFESGCLVETTISADRV